MSPALGDDGKVTVTAPHVVFTKNPEPLVAVKGDVFAVVHQSTVPVRPKPDCDAPLAKVTVLPELPTVQVEPHCTSTVFTSILLIILLPMFQLRLLLH